MLDSSVVKEDVNDIVRLFFRVFVPCLRTKFASDIIFCHLYQAPIHVLSSYSILAYHKNGLPACVDARKGLCPVMISKARTPKDQ